MYRNVTSLIQRFGSDISLVVKTDGAIDFSTGKYAQTEIVTPMMGVIGHYRNSELIDNVINFDDMKCSIQTASKVMEGDTIIFDGFNYEIMNVAKLIRSNVLLKTTLQLRKSGIYTAPPPPPIQNQVVKNGIAIVKNGIFIVKA